MIWIWMSKFSFNSYPNHIVSILPCSSKCIYSTVSSMGCSEDFVIRGPFHQAMYPSPCNQAALPSAIDMKSLWSLRVCINYSVNIRTIYTPCIWYSKVYQHVVVLKRKPSCKIIQKYKPNHFCWSWWSNLYWACGHLVRQGFWFQCSTPKHLLTCMSFGLLVSSSLSITQLPHKSNYSR